MKNVLPARSAGRSSGVMVALVQTPCKSGWPSAVRGGVQVFLGASPCPAHIDAARTVTRTHCSFIGLLAFLGCSMSRSFLRARTAENPRDRIISLVAGVLVNRPSRLRHWNR